MTFDVGHPDNFCGGNFEDWLEVNLTPACNAKCSWCIENKGWHPKKHASWEVIFEEIIRHDRKNVILLGGEPTLYPDLSRLITYLHTVNRNVYITTNGSILTPEWVSDNLCYVHGVNISIHHYDLIKNAEITGIALNELDLDQSIQELFVMGVNNTRLNCNCIKGYIDSEEEIHAYIAWAHRIGADNVRFAELKHDENSFVDLAQILDHQYGLNDDPFNCGCNKNVVIDGMPVNFRQMCGMQTDLRPRPQNPRRIYKPVVYYDGKTYDGWQLVEENNTMDKKTLERILRNVERGDLTVEEAQKLITEKIEKEIQKTISDLDVRSHCRY